MRFLHVMIWNCLFHWYFMCQVMTETFYCLLFVFTVVPILCLIFHFTCILCQKATVHFHFTVICQARQNTRYSDLLMYNTLSSLISSYIWPNCMYYNFYFLFDYHVFHSRWYLILFDIWFCWHERMEFFKPLTFFYCRHLIRWRASDIFFICFNV